MSNQDKSDDIIRFVTNRRERRDFSEMYGEDSTPPPPPKRKKPKSKPDNENKSES